MKKTLLILGIITSVILITFFVWFVVLRDKSVPTNEAVRDLLPFGSGEGLDLPSFSYNDTDGEEMYGVSDTGVPVAKLFRVSPDPVAGAVVFSRGGQSFIRYVERATGHIVEMVLPSGGEPQALNKRKITNTTLPKIYEAHFRRDGGAVLIRFLRADTDVVENRIIVLIPPAATTTIDLANQFYTTSSVNLRGEIGDIVVGSGDTLIYGLLDSSNITTSTFAGANSRTIYNSIFTDWAIKTGGNGVFIHTKPSYRAVGHAYNLNTTNGVLNKVLGPLTALSITPNSVGNRIIYSYRNGGLTKTAALNTQNSTSLDIYPSTLAEKCVWSVRVPERVYCGTPVEPISNSEPDNWYMGRSNFSDHIWSFNTNQEIANVIVEPLSTIGVELDVIEPKLSPDEDYLIFINKRDMTLWALSL